MATPNKDLPKSAEEKGDRVHLDDHAVGVILAACPSEGKRGRKRKQGNGLPGFLSSDFTLQRQKTFEPISESLRCEVMEVMERHSGGETVDQTQHEVMEAIERMEAIQRSGGASPSFAKLICLGRKLLSPEAKRTNHGEEDCLQTIT